MNISEIELNKKFTATFKNVKAKVNYRIDEDWFVVHYFKYDHLMLKNVHKTSSEQNIIETIRTEINKILEND